MAGLPPGDPQLVSMIVSHLKTQGLFDQFRRECLADVDTKPAYLNLKQRVDNFVSNHLSNHTWSPHLNKNQLRNNIRQLVLQSGMLEQGVDRIVAQVVDPKINHIFRPQVERVVREFLSPGSCSEEPPAPVLSVEPKPDSSITEQASSSAPTTTGASDAMSILDTINSLNQKANVQDSSEKVLDEPMELDESEQDMGVVDKEVGQLEEADETKMTSELDTLEVKMEDIQEQREVVVKEELTGEVKMEEESSGDHEQKGDEKEKTSCKTPGKSSEEKQDDDQLKSPIQAKQKAKERMKEEYSLEDSDLEGLSDITVSSVHTSDLSSFEGQSDDEQLLSDSSEEGELPSDDEGEMAGKKLSGGDTGEEDKKCKPRRKAYVHKPFLYSRYYSDSDDEITVEERRRSAAKDKEERLLKRQQNRERMEEKRKQKAAQADEQSHKKQKRTDSAGFEGPRAKEARKERKVLEKKMALNRKRKLDSRKDDVSSRKKGDVGGEGSKRVELKVTTSKTQQPKLLRNLSESASSEERHRRTSGSISEDSSETKKLCDKGLTHSFILDLEQGSQEALKQRSGKFDRPSRKELHIKERKEKERSLSDERAKLKQKQEKKSEHQADETQQKEGVKISSEEKIEKKLKIKGEKKITANTREGRISLSEGVGDEGLKDVKKVKITTTEAAKADKDKEKDKTREKDKCKEKEKPKGEKTSAKSDFKPLQRPESTGSSEDRSDMDPGSDSSKKKLPKEVPKRSKSHSEDKQGEKTKSKTDTKETDREKTKADQDNQKMSKSNSETDPKRVKPAEKGTTGEKIKSKSKEEAKTLLLSKTEKKVQSSEVKGVAGVSISKPEMTKEKKKERSAKEQRKVSEEPSLEKLDVKSGKKKLEKDKIPDKNNESQDEKKELTEEKLERSDKSSKSSVSSLSLETEEVPKKQPLLQDTSADSDPVTTTVTTSFSDDTCDALSDITPEPPEGDTDSQLCEVPAQADALLTLMDVCTSAEARLPPECFREDVSSERALEDADMKMKEAALTLLSMDPDSTVPSSFIIHRTTAAPVENEAAPQAMQIAAVQEEPHPPVDVAAAAEMELTTTEASPAPCQHTAELMEENPNTADWSGTSEREMDTSEVEISETLGAQVSQDSLEEDEAKKAEIPSDAQLKDEPTPPAAEKEAADAVVVKPVEVEGTTGDNAGCVVCSITENVSETSLVSSEEEQTEPEVSDTKMSPKQTEEMAEENLANTNADDSEAESKKVESEHVSAMREPQSMETNVPDNNEETSEGEPDMSELVNPIRSISSADSQEGEKDSQPLEKEERNEGRGRRKRKLSSEKVVKECASGDEKVEEGTNENEQQSAEETEQTPVAEVKMARREPSSGTTDETEKDQPEKVDEPLSNSGGRSETEAIDDNQNIDGNKQEESSSGEPAENEQTKEESTTKKSDEREISLPTPVQDNDEAAGSPESENTADTPKPTGERRASEEMEESLEETQADKKVNEDDGQQEESEQLPQKDDYGLSSRSPSEEQVNVKEASSIENKLDETEEEQQQEDQEATPKKTVRRGRPPKAAAAATEDSDKKDKKVEKKESEQKDDDEEEDGEKEEERETATTRATTRLASRLEAERNKPSKPSTRASRQSGKDETAAGTRGTRGQAAAGAAKGGRKREASPPAVRTRGGQKSEEPPSKRAKR